MAEGAANSPPAPGPWSRSAARTRNSSKPRRPRWDRRGRRRKRGNGRRDSCRRERPNPGRRGKRGSSPSRSRCGASARRRWRRGEGQTHGIRSCRRGRGRSRARGRRAKRRWRREGRALPARRRAAEPEAAAAEARRRRRTCRRRQPSRWRGREARGPWPGRKANDAKGGDRDGWGEFGNHGFNDTRSPEKTGKPSIYCGFLRETVIPKKHWPHGRSRVRPTAGRGAPSGQIGPPNACGR